MKQIIRSATVTLLAIGLVTPSLATATAQAGDGVPLPHFVEETATAGIDQVYDGEFAFFVGGGVGVFDCDADRRPDLYIAGGTELASLYRNASPIGGALLFDEIVDEATGMTEVTGAYPIDIDGDDIVDLVVLRRGENVLLRGLGDCTFERANETWGFDGQSDWTVAFSAKWEAGAARPTLALGDYLTIVDPGEQPICDDSALYRPEADGSDYAKPMALIPGYCSLSMLFSDWDRSGRSDLRVSNDRQYSIDGEEQLWRVEADQAARLWTRDEGWERLRIFGMGIASQDLSGDGYPELYITSMGDNKLQALSDGPDRPSYEDIALDRGVTATQPFAGGEALPSTAWHAEFDDVNNDGRMDLFVSKGNVDAMPEAAARDPNNLLLGKPDGSFKEAAELAGILDFGRSRGAAVVDLNLDGLLDLIVVERREPVRLWRNVGQGSPDDPAAMGNWLSIELSQDGPNVDAIGSWVEVRSDGQTVARELTIGGGHASGQLGPMHFGLGDASEAEIRVTWPGGERTGWMPTMANKRVSIERGNDAPVDLETAEG
ncbi:MAG: CRTAC1 family protein [Chloroflexota bacterium]